MCRDNKALTGIILAGGKSRRMKQNKSFLPIDGKPMIEVLIGKLSNIFAELIIVTNSITSYQYLRKGKITLVKDLIPNQGPLGGIYTGLVTSNNLYNFVIACDMPLPNIKLIKYMQKNSQGYDVVMPSFDKGLEPLFAIYSKTCLPSITESLSRKNPKIISFLSGVSVRYIQPAEIAKLDRGYLSFYNVNTPGDYSRVLKLR